jgi:hypothetical protein
MESEALSAQIPQPWLQLQVDTTQMPHPHDPFLFFADYPVLVYFFFTFFFFFFFSNFGFIN